MIIILVTKFLNFMICKACVVGGRKRVVLLLGVGLLGGSVVGGVVAGGYGVHGCGVVVGSVVGGDIVGGSVVGGVTLHEESSLKVLGREGF